MKNYIYLLIFSLLGISCTEEVFLDELENVETRLVIEANIDISKDDNITSVQTITITNTSSFYNQDYPPVSGAIISVTNTSNNSVATFIETDELGTYQSTDFITPSIGDIYTLSVTVDNETYTAHDTFTSIVDINTPITQEIVTFPQEIIQLNINIDNEIGVDNFYLFQVDTPFRILPEYGNGDDKLLNEEPGENNQDFVYFDEELETGMNVDITLYGISESYNNYLTKLLTLAQESGGPFSTAPATVRGNFLNTSNQDNYALGFFSLNQFVTTTYTIE